MKHFKWIFLSLGLLIFAWAIRKFDYQQTRDQLQLIGWRLIFPILLFIPNYVVRSRAWQIILHRMGEKPSLWKLVRLHVASGAVEAITPLDFAAGDPTKGWLLSSTLPGHKAASSIIIDRTAEITATIFLITAGASLMIYLFDLPTPVRLLLTTIPLCLIALVIVLIFSQHKGLVEKLTGVLSFLRIKKFSPKAIEKIKSVDKHVGDFYRNNPLTALSCLGLHLVGRSTTIFEFYILSKLLGVPMSWEQAVFFASVIPLTILCSTFIPGSLGVLETVIAGLFGMMNWNTAAGLSVQIARRLRGFFWIIVGFVFFNQLSHEAQKKSRKKNPSHRDEQVIILAAGCSRRLAHLTREMPKSFLTVKGKKLMEYHLENLNQRGFRDVVIVVGYRREMIMNHFGDSYKNLRIRYVVSEDYDTTSHAWSIYLTKKTWAESKKPIVLIHADVFMDPKLIDAVIDTPYENVIPADDQFESKTLDEVIVQGENDRIICLDRGVRKGPKTAGELVGVHKFSSHFFEGYLDFMEEFFKANGNADHYETVLDAFLKERRPTAHYIKTGHIPWININYEEDLKTADQDISARIV